MRPRGKDAPEIRATAPQIRTSLTTLYRWERTWRINGLGGLAGLYGDHIGERPPHFVKLGDQVARKVEPQLAELGLAVCEQDGDEPKGAGWFVWKPLRPALRSWLKMVVQRESPRFRARGSRSSRRRLAG